MNLLNDLGSVEETIPENFTSEKLFNAVDNCLYEAAEEVIHYTTLYEELLSIFYTIQTRKKISNIDDDKFNDLFSEFYNCKKEKKVEILRLMKLNRDLVIIPIEAVVDKSKYFLSNVVNGKANHVIMNYLMIRNRKKDCSLFFIKTKEALQRYNQMKTAIIEKYYRMIVKDVGKYSPILGRVDKEDFATEYYINMLRAFSKFDISSGVFTSYLKNWFEHAKNVSLSNDEVGVVYKVPNGIRYKIAKGEVEHHNYNVDMDHEDAKINNVAMKDAIVNMEMVNQEENMEISNLIAHCDPTGLYRLLNDIEMDMVEHFKL